MVIFLEGHKYSLDSKNFQNAFSYAIYDFLEDKKEQGVYQELKKKYGLFLGKLEEISQETMIVNEHRQNNELLIALIKNCAKGGQEEFIKDIRPYLLPMLHSGSRPVSYDQKNNGAQHPKLSFPEYSKVTKMKTFALKGEQVHEPNSHLNEWACELWFDWHLFLGPKNP